MKRVVVTVNISDGRSPTLFYQSRLLKMESNLAPFHSIQDKKLVCAGPLSLLVLKQELYGGINKIIVFK